MTALHFQPTPPYDFAHTLHAGSSLYVMAELHDGAYRRAIRVGRELALIEATSSGTIDAPSVDVEVLASTAPLDPVILEAKSRRILNIGADLRPFYALAQTDPVLRATVEKLYGLHSLQSDSLFE